MYNVYMNVTILGQYKVLCMVFCISKGIYYTLMYTSVHVHMYSVYMQTKILLDIDIALEKVEQ